MRAMSLAVDDTEGEQNELRNLQCQLETTNNLVQTLSTQLAELKEQVTSESQERHLKATWSICGFLILLQNHVNQYKL